MQRRPARQESSAPEALDSLVGLGRRETIRAHGSRGENFQWLLADSALNGEKECEERVPGAAAEAQGGRNPGCFGRRQACFEDVLPENGGFDSAASRALRGGFARDAAGYWRSPCYCFS